MDERTADLEIQRLDEYASFERATSGSAWSCSTTLPTTSSSARRTRSTGPSAPSGSTAKAWSGTEVRTELEGRGIVVAAASTSLLAEEAPFACKDVSRVVGVVEAVGLSRRVARLRALGVLKG